jgi:hypothetical protein
MAVVGWFIDHFRRLGLKPFQIAGDEGGVGKVIMDRMGELGFRGITRVNNGEKAKDPEHFYNLGAEQWSIVAELIEQQAITIKKCDEILVKQLCSRQKNYDSNGRPKLQPKSEMKENSPDRADALIGAICFSPLGADPYATRPVAKKEDQIALNDAMYTTTERMMRSVRPSPPASSTSHGGSNQGAPLARVWARCGGGLSADRRTASTPSSVSCTVFATQLPSIGTG